MSVGNSLNGLSFTALKKRNMLQDHIQSRLYIYANFLLAKGVTQSDLNKQRDKALYSGHSKRDIERVEINPLHFVKTGLLE